MLLTLLNGTHNQIIQCRKLVQIPTREFLNITTTAYSNQFTSCNGYTRKYRLLLKHLLHEKQNVEAIHGNLSIMEYCVFLVCNRLNSFSNTSCDKGTVADGLFIITSLIHTGTLCDSKNAEYMNRLHFRRQQEHKL